MMLTGCMFQLAMQYGLHRPSHAQDFSRFRVDLREEDIADRLNTWAAVNIVAQMVSTGHGQPPVSRWAWYTYGLHLDRMKSELGIRCQIEKFVDTVTRTLFTMQRDHIVEVDQAQRGLQIDMYARELNEMELTIMSTRGTSMSRPDHSTVNPALTIPSSDRNPLPQSRSPAPPPFSLLRQAHATQLPNRPPQRLHRRLFPPHRRHGTSIAVLYLHTPLHRANDACRRRHASQAAQLLLR